jgi:hypothetical protein
MQPKLDNKNDEGISMENNKIEENQNKEKIDKIPYIINKLNDLTIQL